MGLNPKPNRKKLNPIALPRAHAVTIFVKEPIPHVLYFNRLYALMDFHVLRSLHFGGLMF